VVLGQLRRPVYSPETADGVIEIHPAARSNDYDDIKYALRSPRRLFMENNTAMDRHISFSRLMILVAMMLVVGALIVACAAPDRDHTVGAATSTASPLSSPQPLVTTAPIAPPVLPTSTAMPVLDQTSAPIEPTSAPAVHDPTVAIVAVVQQQLPEARISVRCVQGQFAEAIALPPPDVASHGTALYLQRVNGDWRIAASGLGIFQEDLNSLGFPSNFCNVPSRDVPPSSSPVLGSPLKLQLRNGAGKTAQIFLYAADEQVTSAQAPFCGANVGDTLRSGTYELFVQPEGVAEPVAATVALFGPTALTFNDQRPWMLQLIAGRLANGTSDVLLVRQYASCTSYVAAALMLAPDGVTLVQLSFDSPEGSAAVIDVGLDVDTSAHSGLFVTRTYNNVTGETIMTTWQVLESEGRVVPLKQQDDAPTAAPTASGAAPSPTTEAAGVGDTAQGLPSDAPPSDATPVPQTP
jgi:hypothetical protein